MKRVIFISAILAICMCVNLNAQTVYVDAAKGSDASAGTKTSPVATIEKANELLNGFAGKQQLTIKLEPGLYVLNHKIAIGSSNGMVDTLNYSIQADIMPDDTNCSREKCRLLFPFPLIIQRCSLRTASVFWWQKTM